MQADLSLHWALASEGKLSNAAAQLISKDSSDWSADVIKPFSCSTQLSMIFFHDNKSQITYSFLLNMVAHENFSANKYENTHYCWHFHIY